MLELLLASIWWVTLPPAWTGFAKFFIHAGGPVGCGGVVLSGSIVSLIWVWMAISLGVEEDALSKSYWLLFICLWLYVSPKKTLACPVLLSLTALFCPQPDAVKASTSVA